ncbi:g8436 [Coccomyxa elongata]
MDNNVLAEHMKMKQDFESSLPPPSDSKNLSERRKKMLEAWEKAEWSAREVQLQALQEEQLQAFQADMVAQDGKGGRGKQRRLTPLEAFVHSNTPLQGRSLLKSKSQDTGDLQLIGLVSKSQTTTKTLPSSGGALRSASDIGAYRPQAGRTAARKEAAYAQHLENVHRAILQEKELEAREAIASQLASPPEPHPKAFLEQAAMMNIDTIMTNSDITMAHDNGAAQVLGLGSRGSTAEGWLTTPESGSSPVMSLLTADSAPTEVTEEAQSPLLQEGSQAEWLDERLTAADISTGDAATSAAAPEEEAFSGQHAEAEAGTKDTLPLECSWDISRQVDSLAEDTAVWDNSEGNAAAGPFQAQAQGDITDAVAGEAAFKSLENGGQVDEPLPVKEAVATFAEETADEHADVPLAEPAVEEFQAGEDVADKPRQNDEEVEIAPVEEAFLAPEEKEPVRPDTASGSIDHLTEAATTEDVPALQEGQIVYSDSEASKTDPLIADTDIGAVTLDHLISQHHRQGSLLASAGVDIQLMPEQDAVAVDSTELRPATAVSQTLNELVAAAEAQLPPALASPAADIQDTEGQISPAVPVQDGHLALAADYPLLPPLLPVPAAEVQDAEEQISPAGPVQDVHLAPLPDTPFEMAAHDADMSLFGAASAIIEQPADTAGIAPDKYAVDTQADMAEAELVDAPEAPAEVLYNIIKESDTTRGTLENLVGEGSTYPNTGAEMGSVDFDPPANLQGHSEGEGAIETAALEPAMDTEAQLQEAEADYDNETYDDSIYANEDSEGKAGLPQTIDEVVEESIGGLVEDAVASL